MPDDLDMQIQPLSFICISKNDPRDASQRGWSGMYRWKSPASRPAYGHHHYVTADKFFTVYRRDGPQIQWNVRGTGRLGKHQQLYEAFHESGLMYASFPRRCDAIEALELLEQMD